MSDAMKKKPIELDDFNNDETEEQDILNCSNDIDKRLDFLSNQKISRIKKPSNLDNISEYIKNYTNDSSINFKQNMGLKKASVFSGIYSKIHKKLHSGKLIAEDTHGLLDTDVDNDIYGKQEVNDDADVAVKVIKPTPKESHAQKFKRIVKNKYMNHGQSSQVPNLKKVKLLNEHEISLSKNFYNASFNDNYHVRTMENAYDGNALAHIHNQTLIDNYQRQKDAPIIKKTKEKINIKNVLDHELAANNGNQPNLPSFFNINLVNKKIGVSMNEAASASIIMIIVITLYCYRFYNILPGFVYGFIFSQLFSCLVYLFFKIFRHYIWKNSYGDYKTTNQMLSDTSGTFPHYKNSNIFQGWVNISEDYADNTSFHLNDTNTVYVELYLDYMFLKYPNKPVLHKSLWNDVIPEDIEFIDVKKIYFTNFEHNSTIEIIPKNIPKRHLWNRKYPLKLTYYIENENYLKDAENQNSKLSNSLTKLNPTFTATTETEPDLINVNSEKKFKKYKIKRCSSLAADFDQEILIDELSLNSGSKYITEHVYLFGRTDRQKEDWFRRISYGIYKSEIIQEDLDDWVDVSDDLLYELRVYPKIPHLTDYFKKMYNNHMLKTMKLSRSGIGGQRHLPAINSIITRIFWDLFRNPYWTNDIKKRIENKLSVLRVPFFIDNLAVNKINLGNNVPIVRKLHFPQINDQGLWISVEIEYSGGFNMELETKINLLKLKKYGQSESEKCEETKFESKNVQKDLEFGIDASSEDESGPGSSLGGSKEDSGLMKSQLEKKTFMRIVDKVAKSKYFQTATDNKFIKKAIEGVSQTSIGLNVEVNCIDGVLMINIPPPPTCRIWYSFLQCPNILFKAKPKVGQRVVNTSLITDWIEKKLLEEFQKVLVLPNMDDIMVPILTDFTFNENSNV